MNSRTKPLIILWAAAAVGALTLHSWSDLFGLAPRAVGGLAAFIGLAVIAEIMAVDVRVGSGRTRSSVSFLPILACAITFPSSAAIVAVIFVYSVVELFLKKPILWRLLFNVSQMVVATSVGAVLYSASAVRFGANGIGGGISFGALIVGFFGVNLLSVVAFVSVDQQRPAGHVVRQAIGPGGGNLLYDGLASPIALIAAILYDNLYVWGLVLVIFPILLIRYSYLSKLQLQKANGDLLKVLIKAIETRDPYTSGHSVRVASLAQVIAQQMRLSRHSVDRLMQAALLHDIGKIDMAYAPLIRKASDLTAEERRTIQTHATKGSELLRELTSLDAAIIQGVRHHHERFDGTGYPDGLRGSDIPLFARIIMICDSVDAMLSDRPYRPALRPDAVRSELLRYSGTQFDPELVRVLLRASVIEHATDTLFRGESPIETNAPTIMA
jgi:putative nucleotidyltransferase with HDIG domain